VRSLVAAALCLNACSAPAPATGTSVDGSLADAASEVAPEEGPPMPDVGTAEVISHGMTTGKPCTSNAECDVTGEGVNVCSDTHFSYGTLWPDPICIGRTCELGAFYCDGGKGVCTTQDGLLCLPVCNFRGDGVRITECTGRSSCSYVKLGKDTKGAFGVGFCKPACTADDQCKRGDKCQRETGVCMTTVRTYTKVVGDPCNGGSTACRCNVNAPMDTGYCTSSCVVGDTAACPAGFVCHSGLRRLDPADGSELFALDPPGLGGTCARTCTKDSDCAAYGPKFRCEDRTSGKVCLPL